MGGVVHGTCSPLYTHTNIHTSTASLHVLQSEVCGLILDHGDVVLLTPYEMSFFISSDLVRQAEVIVIWVD